MLAESRSRILTSLDEGAVVLDVGGGGHPFARADWVMDILSYEDRGMYGTPDPDAERFDSETWIVRDVCDRQPFPFGDDEVDFAVCSHTLEDIRDPVWVCSELSRVARAGYVEVPSRLEEQTFGVHGPWVGWSHHRWLTDVADGRLQFVAKPAVLQSRPDFSFPVGFADSLSAAERVEAVFWKGSQPAAERIFLDGPTMDAYLREPVDAHAHRVPLPGRVPLSARVRARLLRSG